MKIKIIIFNAYLLILLFQCSIFTYYYKRLKELLIIYITVGNMLYLPLIVRNLISSFIH